MWFFFISKRAPLVVRRAKEKIKNIEEEENNSFEVGTNPKKKKLSFKQKILKFIRNSLILLKFITFDFLIIYYMLYTSCAILGMFHPVFIALMLFDVFLRYPVLLHILKSIWRPRYQIILTLFLFVILQYYFTLVAFYWFYKDFDPLCEDLWNCFSIIFDQTYKVFRKIDHYYN